MKKSLVVFLFLLFFYFSFGQSGGRSVYSFLNLSSPARTAALGGAIISVKDNDVNLSFQNPSLLDSSMNNALSLSYINYLAGIHYGYAGYAHTFKKVGNFSAAIQYVDYGSFKEANTVGDITGSFSATESAFNMGYSRMIKDSCLSVGATLKTIYSRLGEYTSVGNAMDMGAVYYNPKRFFSSGIVLKNIGKQWTTYNTEHESLPFEIQVGFSKKLKHAPLRISLTFIHLEKWDLTYTNPTAITKDPITGKVIEKSKSSQYADKIGRHLVFGGEVLISKNFHLRVGYNYLKRQELKVTTRPGITGFSFGFGLRVYKFMLSYAYAPLHLAGGTNHFTIGTNLSNFYSRH
jgi:hypothetical protein